MNIKQARDKLINDGVVMKSMPKSDGSRVFTIDKEKIRYNSAQKLINELNLTSNRINPSLVEYCRCSGIAAESPHRIINQIPK